ncbi:MAG: DUF1080 domain-containing protein [Deltaproteobacteria bacterium]|nr:DUF1080 domain-containing protein [Deltaproteobacteria bacterium]
MRRRHFLAAAGGAVCLAPAAAFAGKAWQPLWNGRDLQGWTTWVGIPHRSRVGLPLPKNPDGTYAEPLGENNDPRGVYTVVERDGQKLLRISGELFGALTTLATFGDYHLYAKWCWGEKQWKPRATGPRDAGILLHATGKHGASGPSHNWMRSIECQIQEGDCGDLWSVGGVQVKARAVPYQEGATPALRFDPAARRIDVPLNDPTHEPRVRRSHNAERPRGQWNVTEIITRGNAATFVVNGARVMEYEDAHILEEGRRVPLRRGRIQLQSEGAEIFFADVRLRGL